MSVKSIYFVINTIMQQPFHVSHLFILMQLIHAFYMYLLGWPPSVPWSTLSHKG